MTRTLRILGTRGIPAAHGGFETFAECLSTYLVAKAWRVIVYCQQDGSGPVIEDEWKGVQRVVIPVSISGSAGSVVFDWLATRHAAKRPGLCLTLGYNTASFCVLLRSRRRVNLFNMDGIEWSRRKWGAVAKMWFWLNDWAGCWLGNHLIADNPGIEQHLATRVRDSKISMIPYGADRISAASASLLSPFGLLPGKFLTLIARPEPENSLLEIVQGFSARPRGMNLVVLGRYDGANAYHRSVQAAAGDEVQFVGAIYDKAVLKALRFHSVAYLHGHQVGGTNPSLVEAMGAGNAIIAHDNRYNRWVAGDRARYFSDSRQLDRILCDLLADPEGLAEMRAASVARYEREFTWEHILSQYEQLLIRFADKAAV